MGYVDFAGSTVVHAIGGFAAMELAMILGPRLGKYGPDGKPRPFPAHNLVFVVTGTFILLFGWMGFNPGSTLGATDLRISVIAVNTNLAAVAGAATAMVFWYYRFGKPDITMACNGMLAGLVAITAPCAFVSPTSAVVIGILAGVLVCLGVLFNERVIKVDDCPSRKYHLRFKYLYLRLLVYLLPFVSGAGMTDDLSGEAMAMIERDGGAHQRSMPHE
jgi:ammonium transporter, Amt family